MGDLYLLIFHGYLASSWQHNRCREIPISDRSDLSLLFILLPAYLPIFIFSNIEHSYHLPLYEYLIVFRCIQPKAFRHISRARTRNLENPWHCCVQVWKPKRGEKEDKTEKCEWLRISVMYRLRWIVLLYLEIVVKDYFFVYKIDFSLLIWRTHILTWVYYLFLHSLASFLSLSPCCLLTIKHPLQIIQLQIPPPH